jgi:ABC-2 type transport system ATP-binding protein
LSSAIPSRSQEESGTIATDEPRATVLEAKDIIKVYGTRFHARRVRALDGASFSLGEGEICGLVGPNGAGKSTLIKIIMGIEKRNAGAVSLAGDRGIIGYVPERPTFFEDLSAQYNLLYFARLYRLPDPEEAVNKALADFGLADRAEDFVSEYSKGMKQRLAIARALLHSPKVVLMDEPFSGLDPSAMLELRAIFKGLKSTNMSILLSSHELNEIDQVCDAILFIKDGRILRKEGFESGTKVNLHLVILNPGDFVLKAIGSRRVLSSSEDRTDMTVEAEKEEVPEIVAAVVQAGGRIMEARVVQRKAEDMYAEFIMKEAQT